MIKIDAKFLAKSLLCILLVGSMMACSKKTKEAIVEPAEVSKAVQAAAPVAAKAFPQNKVAVDYRGRYVLPSVGLDSTNTSVKSYYDKWKAQYIKKVTGTDQYIVDMWEFEDEAKTKKSPPRTTSESISYGMVITAYMAGYDKNAKAQFDGLFKYARKYPSLASPYLMGWEEVGIYTATDRKEVKNMAHKKDFPAIDNPRYSATDGDMDIAYALLLADKQWGSTGDINYKAEALKTIQAIYTYDVNKKDWNLKIGEQAPEFDTHTRPSDFMPGHIQVFKAVDTVNATGWQNVNNTIFSIMDFAVDSKEYAPSSSLLPDFMVKNGDNWVAVPGKYIEDEHDADYNYNSCRTPWRIGTAVVTRPIKANKGPYPTYFGQNIIGSLNEFVALQGGASKFKAGYYVGSGPVGTTFVDYEDTSFTSPLGVAAMTYGFSKSAKVAQAAKASAQARTDASWALNKTFDSKDGDYFSHSINMQVILVMSGNWWTPQN